MVDVEEGITPMDAEVAKLLRKVTKPILVAVNKVDNAMREKDAIEFYNLGLGEYFTIASISGSGTGELLDELVNVLPELPEVTEEEAALPADLNLLRTEAANSLPFFAAFSSAESSLAPANAMAGIPRTVEIITMTSGEIPSLTSTASKAGTRSLSP